MNIQRIDEQQSNDSIEDSGEPTEPTDSFFGTSSESEEEPDVYTLVDDYETIAANSWVPQEVLKGIIEYADALTICMFQMTSNVIRAAINVSLGYLKPFEYKQKLLIAAATGGHLDVYQLLAGDAPVRFSRGIHRLLHDCPADVIVKTHSAETVRKWIRAGVSLTEEASHVAYHERRLDVFKVLVEEGQPIMRFVKGLIRTWGPVGFARALDGSKA